YDRGSSAVETNQSTLDTRPSIPSGTNRCLAVAQAIVPAASSPFTRTQARASRHAWGGAPVPGHREGGDGPGPVHVGDELARDADPADRQRRHDRAESTRGEHQAQ